MKYIIYSSLFIMPSMIMNIFSLSSLSYGLTIFSILLITYEISKININSKFEIKIICFLILAPFFLLFHYILITQFDLKSDDYRFFGGILLLIINLMGALLFFQEFKYDEKIQKYTEFTLIIIIINCILGLTNIKISDSMSHKPVGLFSEPSHVALTIAPLLIFSQKFHTKRKIIYPLFFLIWGIYIENLTTIIAVVFSTLIYFRWSFKKTLSIIISMALLGYLVMNSEYFSERLKISPESNNLSVLVLLKGWEEAIHSNNETFYLGVGFQQFGGVTGEGPIYKRIQNLGEGLENLNKYDGGSVAAKLFGEFGFLFFFFIFLYFISLKKSFKILTLTNNSTELPLFFAACIFSLPIELFIRGTGYFTPTLFLLASSIFCKLNRIRKI